MQNRARLIQFWLATAVGLVGLFVNPANLSSPHNASLLTQAQAEFGRPLTIVSIAGVNRRVERRAARRAYYRSAGYYGAYTAGYPGGYYGLYGSYDGYASVYPAGYYGGCAFPRYYNTGWMWWW
jgi:hypothetical protein